LILNEKKNLFSVFPSSNFPSVFLQKKKQHQHQSNTSNWKSIDALENVEVFYNDSNGHIEN